MNVCACVWATLGGRKIVTDSVSKSEYVLSVSEGLCVLARESKRMDDKSRLLT